MVAVLRELRLTVAFRPKHPAAASSKAAGARKQSVVFLESTLLVQQRSVFDKSAALRPVAAPLSSSVGQALREIFESVPRRVHLPLRSAVATFVMAMSVFVRCHPGASDSSLPRS